VSLAQAQEEIATNWVQHWIAAGRPKGSAAAEISLIDCCLPKRARALSTPPYEEVFATWITPFRVGYWPPAFAFPSLLEIPEGREFSRRDVMQGVQPLVDILIIEIETPNPVNLSEILHYRFSANEPETA